MAETRTEFEIQSDTGSGGMEWYRVDACRSEAEARRLVPRWREDLTHARIRIVEITERVIEDHEPKDDHG